MTRVRFLIAPDKFKGSLHAVAVAENIARGIRDVLPAAEIEIAPVADGGEGTAEIIRRALGGEWVTGAAHDALGRPIDACYGWMKKARGAVMEMSEAAGLRRLALDERHPLQATTFGVGEMIADAVGRGATQITLGLGGSATNDGGFGMARALGFRFIGESEEELERPGDLVKLTRIEQPESGSLPRIFGAVDVRNPLLGERGAARTFGRQKGATPEQIELLESALSRLADVVARDLGCDFRTEPGAGAAGGLGFGLMSFCGAELRAGFEIVAEAIGLREKIERADIVITGEGRLDTQTLEGKAPAGVAQLAGRSGKPVYAIVGETEPNSKTSDLFDNILELARPPITREEAMNSTAELLRERASELGAGLRSAHS